MIKITKYNFNSKIYEVYNLNIILKSINVYMKNREYHYNIRYRFFYKIFYDKYYMYNL